jgi:dipeptidase D
MEPKLKEILDIFEEINTIPRKSKNEEKISNWLVDWAKSHNLEVKQDKALNVYIYVPATSGRENNQTVILQGHMDMVCEKTPDSPHDFSKDAIKHIIDDEWMHADNTTLGADNGIAIAIALAMATDDSISHPPLELLFTVDEETGLNGAVNLEQDFLKGRILLNLDSEDEGVFTIGCAGGRDVGIRLGLQKDTSFTPDVCFKLAVDGLRGGHSGVDIHEQRENANVLLARLLSYLSKEIDSIRLSDISGGSAHNAIPRNAAMTVYVPSEARDSFKNVFNKTVEKLEAVAQSSGDKDVKISLTEVQNQLPVYTAEDTKRLINLLNALPHGVIKMSIDIDGLVETSTNFATITFENDTVATLSSQRSSVATQLDWIVSRIESVATLAGAAGEANQGYPGWEPNPGSKLLALCKNVYKELYGKEPHVEAIHAGLECGLIGAKFSDMDMISFGPTLKNPHSPQEKLHLPSVMKIWDFTKELLKAIN